MEVTYSYARQFLNTAPTISAVIAVWPILMEPKYMVKHFEKLCCINTSECMSIFTEKKIRTIEKIKSILKDTEATATEDIDNVQTLLKLVCKYLKEDITIIFQNCQVCVPIV